MEDANIIQFLRGVLRPGISDEYLNKILSPASFNKYFRRVFVIGNNIHDLAARKGNFDYEVLEKVGDRVLGASFQLYLFEIMGDTVAVPQPYADMEKFFLNTENLAKLTEELGFQQFMNFDSGMKSADEIKEDVFESMVGAITLAGDEFVAQDFGFSLAKRWIYKIFNTYIRDKIDPTESSKYVDYRTQVSEIWSFNGWPDANYSFESRGTCPRKNIPTHTVTYNLIGPNHNTFPAKYKNKTIGWGFGNNVKEAKEDASKHAIEVLNANFADIQNSEVEYSKLDYARIAKVLKLEPSLAEKMQALLQNPNLPFESFSIRHVKMGKLFYGQLRVKRKNMPLASYVRSNSEKSKEDVAIKLVSEFISRVEKDEFNKGKKK